VSVLHGEAPHLEQLFKDYREKDVQVFLVPLASNLIIDEEGKIRFYSLLNTTDFDAKLVHVKQKLNELINAAGER
jgi:UDP-N-acetylenolpyruvoylglucosamine reductase